MNRTIDDDVIGREGMPNLYVKGITLHDLKSGNNKKGVLVEVELFCYNTINIDGKLKFDEVLRNSYLQILVSSDSSLTNYILSNNFDLEHRLIRQQTRSLGLKIENKELPLITRNDIRKMEYKEMTPFSVVYKFRLENEPKNLTLFANICGKNKIKSPMVVEKII